MSAGDLFSEGFNYFSLEYALEQHEVVLQESGGLSGLLNPGQLECILSMMRNDDYYYSFVDKLSYLVYSVIMDHIFCDANKRTSIALGAYFLEINGYEEYTVRFMQEMEFFVVMVAEHQLSRNELSVLLADIISGQAHTKVLNDKIDRYKESLKAL